jgi:hypothetical protein
MGPPWLVEGFAVVAADQGFGEDLTFSSPEEALAPIDWHGRYAYASAAACVRFFLQRVQMRELLAQAQSPAFEDWLRAVWRERGDVARSRLTR